MTDAEYDVRQRLSDIMIAEINAEIDADTIRRFRRGERILETETGPVWTYFVDAKNRVVDEHGYLLDAEGSPTDQLGEFKEAT